MSAIYANPPVSSPTIIIKDAWIPDSLRPALSYNPRTHLGRAVREILRFLPDSPSAREAAAELLDRLSSCVVIESALFGSIKRGWLSLANYNDRRPFEDLGLLGSKVVTNAGVGYIVDAFQNLVELENMKYHGLGTGSGAEAASDSALGTELTTEYTSNVRATGTTTEAAANIYQTVGANLLDGTPGAALREHGVFSANSAGVLLDRTVFAAITASSGDTITTDYRLTLTSGS